MISPILFNIQVNEIHSFSLTVKVICYAKDTVMLCLGDLWEETLEIINKDLKFIKQRLIENNLFLNLEKTCVVPNDLTVKMVPIKQI